MQGKFDKCLSSFIVVSVRERQCKEKSRRWQDQHNSAGQQQKMLAERGK